MRLLDMHAHLFCMMEKNKNETDGSLLRAMAEREIALRCEMGVVTFLSSGTPWEWEFVRQFASWESLLFSFGIHPWYAEQFAAEPLELTEAYRMCDAVGEIGMDCVWCEISDMIRGFPEPVCVHWYSGDLKSLEAFLKQDCYFTLGPDLARNMLGKESRTVHGVKDAESQDFTVLPCERAGRGLYQYMLREIPVNRLFVETDGISAVAWAKGQERAEIREIQQVLEQNMDCIADVKKMQRDELRNRVWKNLGEFLRKSGTGRAEILQGEAGTGL